MNIEFTEPPNLTQSGIAYSEVVKATVTTDEGESQPMEARAILMEVDGLTCEAWATTVEGKQTLALTTFKTVATSENDTMEKVYNTATQSEDNELTVLENETVSAPPVEFHSNDDVRNFIIQEYQQFHESDFYTDTPESPGDPDTTDSDEQPST